MPLFQIHILFSHSTKLSVFYVPETVPETKTLVWSTGTQNRINIAFLFILLFLIKCFTFKIVADSHSM